MKPMRDGERRTMKPTLWADRHIDVIAERVDSDTPYVVLRNRTRGAEIYLTDSGAKDVIERMQRALRVLPSSK